ncbi:MAG TPA: hypothetical protein DEE98_05715 [Elusimicrobia bacterium]|nr:MAG: hypothetical protein A2278_00940 [Elusimicrobia bacterium RIFOXYA12_FULL_49_49]OGS08886.1 MAG: hypothetical protein A2204_01040 [Elusimicrobia bacterium RIFOXYA1_FULL_47_7]OGS11418.1 MAG: hypothetical protein A2386_04855 [Elusimicrobia bacterium RIFOXYB1_FULL_48_9]OGS15045.1 MAG: hypothetical protein A2251_00100 [Elusimicrobia bacterium RIFOXYA2_FULL_47_53]OGS29383.1 MAG: hypothetical protein A2323_00385 [Elusimicrobia bacterium RIFOXYB2_FULL_46_23]HBU69864.1 hypothetical protein [Elus
MNKINKIILLIIPIILAQAVYPRLSRNALIEALAKQPILVYSFVWVPVMEISMLVIEKILPPANIKPIENTENNNSAPLPDDDAFSRAATPNNISVAVTRITILPLSKLLAIFDSALHYKPNLAFLVLFPLFASVFFRAQTVRLSTPSLPRGDNPLLF